MKKVCAILLIALLTLSAFGCGQEAKDPAVESPAVETPAAEATVAPEATEPAQATEPEWELNKKIYSIGGGTSGSVFVTYTTALGDLLSKNVEGMNITVEPGSSSGNQIALNNKEIDFGIISSLQVYAGTQGTDWAEGNVYKDLYSFIPAYSYEALFITKADSGIASLSDLNGKVLAVGAAGSGSDTTGRQLVEYFGIQPKELVNGSWTDLGGQLQDGLIDAIFYLAGHPASFVTELEINTKLNIFSLTEEEMNSFVGEYPYYAVGTIAAGTYNAVAADLNVLQGWNFIGISADIDDALAYHLAKVVWENISVIHNASASFAQTSLENVQRMNLQVHPGVARYYEEQGVTLPVTVFN